MKLLSIFLTTFSCFVGVQTLAQNINWERTGNISGGMCWAISVGPNGDIYTSVNDSIYRSTDKGLHWQDIRNNIGSKPCRYINCTKDNILFSVSDGIYKSEDNGDSWRKVFGNNVFYNIQSSYDGRIYALGKDSGELYSVSLFASSDKGEHWDKIVWGVDEYGSEFLRYQTLSISPQGYLFLKMNSALLRSTDLGQSWQKAGHISFLRGSDTVTLFEPRTSVVYGKDGSCYVGLGARSPLDPILPCRSTDDGMTWSLIDTNLFKTQYAEVHMIASTKGGDIFIFNDFRNICTKSTDAGKTWTEFDSIDETYSICSATDSSGALYVGSVINIYKVEQGKPQWLLAHPNIGLIKEITADKNGNLLTSVWNAEGNPMEWYYLRNMFMISGDMGNTWEFPTGDPVERGYIDPLDLIHRIKTTESGELLVFNTRAVYLSNDGGHKWRYYAGSGNQTTSDVALADSGRHYMCDLHHDYGISFHYDSGRKRNFLLEGYDNPGEFKQHSYHTLHYVPSGYVFLGMGDGICKIKVGDTVWTRCKAGDLGDTVILFFHPAGDTLYAATNGEGVYMTTDNGGLWKPMNEGLTNLTVTGITGDKNGNVFSSSSDGVFVLRAGSTKWQNISTNISSRYVTTVFYEPVHKVLYAGTRGRGIYRARVDQLQVKDKLADKPSPITITATDDPTRLKVTINTPHSSGISLSVVDILGRKIQILKPNIQGSNYFLFSTKELSTGTYFVLLESGNERYSVLFRK